MYLVEFKKAYDSQSNWGVVRFIARTEGETDLIPYLAQTVSENSVSTIPGNGIYCASLVQRNGVTNVEISTLSPQEAVSLFGFGFKPFTPKLQTPDATLGNGTGSEAKEEAAIRQSVAAGNRQKGIWVKKVTKFGLNPDTITADGRVADAKGKLIPIAELV